MNVGGALPGEPPCVVKDALTALSLPDNPDALLAEHTRTLDAALKEVGGRLIANPRRPGAVDAEVGVHEWREPGRVLVPDGVALGFELADGGVEVDGRPESGAVEDQAERAELGARSSSSRKNTRSSPIRIRTASHGKTSPPGSLT
jgi:hypothetical protein